MAKGVRVTARAVRLASHNRWPTVGSPCRAACNAPLPRISTGMYSGRISSASSRPPRLSPTVSAAPTAPSRLNTGVPSSSESSSTGRQRAGRPSISASSGASSTRANPEKSQCASTLARTRSGRGCGETTHCSREPSSKSLRKSPSSESSTANRAATQTRPGERLCNNCVSGPTASGNNATTMAKNTSGLANSAGRRTSRRASRATSRVKTLLMRGVAPDQVRDNRRAPVPCCGGW
ncbi:hypothetical protein D9M68_399280 [compost metagenome]